MSKKNESKLIIDPMQAYFMAHLENAIRAEYNSLLILRVSNGPSDPVTKSVSKRWSTMIDAFEKPSIVTMNSQ